MAYLQCGPSACFVIWPFFIALYFTITVSTQQILTSLFNNQWGKMARLLTYGVVLNKVIDAQLTLLNIIISLHVSAPGEDMHFLEKAVDLFSSYIAVCI